MNLSERQKLIIEIVKEHQPVSGEKISEILDVSRATLRSDLSFLTMAEILQATPKVGYTYSGANMQSLFFYRIFNRKIEEIMMSQVMIKADSPIREAITTLFVYDIGSLYVMDDDQELVGILSRKDLLRASLNTDIDGTPVAVCMTRVPHIKTCTKDISILEAASIMQDFEIDSLPVVEKDNDRKVIGKITKTRILSYIISHARDTELNK